MHKQTIYLTSAADLSVRQNQLCIALADGAKAYLRSLEDIRTIIVDHHSVHLTIPLINFWRKTISGWCFATNNIYQRPC
ncbi:MAG: hypothetical protein MJZ70_06930 [Bacteroidales bacterium]|nr:hypothetical protein [Bacteroidales bacterium]